MYDDALRYGGGVNNCLDHRLRFSRWCMGILSKNGCRKLSCNDILSAGSYANIFDIRSNSSWWSSKSLIRYSCKNDQRGLELTLKVSFCHDLC